MTYKYLWLAKYEDSDIYRLTRSPNPGVWGVCGANCYPDVVACCWLKMSGPLSLQPAVAPLPCRKPAAQPVPCS